MSPADKSVVQSQPRRLSRRDLVAVSVLIIASVLVVIYAGIETTMVSVSMSGTVTYNGASVAYADFQGIGNYYVAAQCFNVNATLRCPLLVSMSLTTPDKVLHDNLYTRTMMLKVLNGQGTVLAFEMDQYTSPATTYQVAYGLDESLARYITITTPGNIPGSTWTFKIILLNPPVVNGKMALQIDGQAQVVDTHFLGRTYNLDTGMIQLSDQS